MTPETPPPDPALNVDERWIPEWVQYGINQLVEHLDRQARFVEYLEWREHEHHGDPQ